MSQTVDLSLGSEQYSDVFCTQEAPVFPTPNFPNTKAYTCAIQYSKHIATRSNFEGYSNELSRHSLYNPTQNTNLLVIQLHGGEKRITRSYSGNSSAVSSQVVSIAKVFSPIKPLREDEDNKKYPFVLSKQNGGVIKLPEVVDSCVVLVVSGAAVSHYQTRIGEIVSDMIHFSNAAVTMYTKNEMKNVNESADVLRDIFFRHGQMYSHWNTKQNIKVEVKWKVTTLQDYKVPFPISEKYFLLTPVMKRIFLHVISKKMQKDGCLYLMCKCFILAKSNTMPAHGPFPIPYEASQVLDISAFEPWEIDGCEDHLIEMCE